MAKTRIVVLGCGMIGSAIARDLAGRDRFLVAAADASPERLASVIGTPGIAAIHADLSTPDAIRSVAGDFDLVVGALPSAVGFQTLAAVIDAGRPIVDISFMPEDALVLDGTARERGVAAVIDCGVGPGLSSMLAAWSVAQLSSAERVAIYIGGLPIDRRWPFEYKAGFSPHDVVEEYVRPARIVEGGAMVVREALSDAELLEIDGVGTLEAFVTDGLRTLATTLPVPFMVEKTLRYPGHRELMRVLRETGFFSKQPIEVDGRPVRPLDVTAALLFPHWKFAADEADVTVLRVVVSGVADGSRVTHTWTMIDRYDAAAKLRSMSRATAFPAASVATLAADGAFPPGVHPPETVGQRGLLDRVLRDLESRGIRCELEVGR